MTLEAFLSEGHVLPVPLNLQQSSVPALVDVARKATARAKIFMMSTGRAKEGFCSVYS